MKVKGPIIGPNDFVDEPKGDSFAIRQIKAARLSVKVPLGRARQDWMVESWLWLILAGNSTGARLHAERGKRLDQGCCNRAITLISRLGRRQFKLWDSTMLRAALEQGRQFFLNIVGVLEADNPHSENPLPVI